MRRLLLLSGLLWAATGALAQQPPGQAPQGQQAPPPQAPTQSPSQTAPVVEREVRAQPGKPVRIGVFTSIQPDCTSGQLPAVKLGEQPRHGAVIVRQARVRVTNHKQCLAVEVPAFVAFYRPRPDFPGKDVLTLEVRNKDGKMQVQRITIVTGKPAGENI